MLNDNEKDLNIVLLLQIDYFLLYRGTSKNISKISKFNLHRGQKSLQFIPVGPKSGSKLTALQAKKE
jgi:hypothetical protein